MRRLMMVSSMVFLSLVLSVIPVRGAVSLFFTTIDVPGAGRVYARGVNNSRQIVGVYVMSMDACSSFPDYTCKYHSFLRGAAGGFTTIDFPGAYSTVANGINDSGQIVGWYRETQSGPEHGFLRTASGLFTPINVPFPGAVTTQAQGINNSGQIVGSYYDTTGYGRWSGFLFAAGSFAIVDPPDSFWAWANGINDSGQIVGYYQDKNTFRWLGFLFTAGSFSPIDISGQTSANGINNSGQIVGYNSPSHGFLLAQGESTSIDYPGAPNRPTVAYGIGNPNPQRRLARLGLYSIVGSYRGTDGKDHGFVAIPGIPAWCCL